MARPRIISSPEEFDQLAAAYFQKCTENVARPTVTGLALAVGLSSREALDEYAKREEFFDSVKRAKLLVESGYEECLFSPSCTGAIFALKNFGWKDKQELGVSGGLNITNHEQALDDLE